MQLVAERQSVDTIRAEMNYIVDTGTPPVRYIDWPEMEHKEIPPQYRQHEVDIRNGRPLRDSFRLDTHGFVFADHRTAMTDFTDEAKRKRGLQFTLSTAADQLRADDLLKRTSKVERARLRAVSAPHAAAWLRATPADAATRLSNRVYAAAIRQRLGLSHTDDTITGCACGKSSSKPGEKTFDPATISRASNLNKQMSHFVTIRSRLSSTNGCTA